MRDGTRVGCYFYYCFIEEGHECGVCVFSVSKIIIEKQQSLCDSSTPSTYSNSIEIYSRNRNFVSDRDLNSMTMTKNVYLMSTKFAELVVVMDFVVFVDVVVSEFVNEMRQFFDFVSLMSWRVYVFV